MARLRSDFTDSFRDDLPEQSLRLQSAAFGDLGVIPRRYGVGGENVSPPLEWEGVPADARSLAVLLEDRGPAAFQDTLGIPTHGAHATHWLTWGIDVGTSGLGEGEGGPRPGRNDFGSDDYRGPDHDPPGAPVRRAYAFVLLALDNVPELLPRADRAAFDAAVAGHVLGSASLVAHYETRKRSLFRRLGLRRTPD